LASSTAAAAGCSRWKDCPHADPWVNDLLPKLQGKARGFAPGPGALQNAATGSSLIYPRMKDLNVESGQQWYTEELGGRRFQVSASAFFQVNTAQAEEMLRAGGRITSR